MKERFKVIPCVYLILQRDDQILLLKRANTGYMDGMYGLPSGHLEGNEPAIAAAVREAEEETGLTLDRDDLELVHTLHRQSVPDTSGSHERIDLFFAVHKWSGEPQNMEPDKCSELQWYPANALPENMIPEVAMVLQKIAAGARYSDFNFG
ncbi:MAG TPA: NUDIX domain-containing protein [Candidatus Saccharimonadales bacterium]|nr:NUDIX domain-containing protein [Candidatus Saccharimonadales bacterium]